MGLDNGRPLIRLRLFLGLAELLDQPHRLLPKSRVESTTGTSVDGVTKLLVGHVEELLELNSAVGKCPESALFLELGRLFDILVTVG